VGFGVEILFVIMLGLLVLGPKQLHALLGLVARVKAQFEEASRDFESQLTTELDGTHQERETDSSQELVVQGDESTVLASLGRRDGVR
jgi:Sec-independent protein translocase protein TatA